MAATPKKGIMAFIGLRTKQKYNVSVYVSDVAAAKTTFSTIGGADTSDDTYVKFEEDVVLVDFSMQTGTADTTSLTMRSNNNPIPGSVLSYVEHVSTNPARPALTLGFKAGNLIGAVQNA